MAKGGREKIKLESSAGTGHFYTTDKNKKTTPEKIEMMKFERVDRRTETTTATGTAERGH